MKKVTVSVLFSDVAGYSKLNEAQLRVFAEVVLHDINRLLEPYKGNIIEVNTWGDAILIVSSDTSSVAHFALDLRDYYHNKHWAESHLPKDLKCRIGLHSGTVFIGENPLRGAEGVIGTQINLAARIEPMTPTGQVFATDTFVKLLEDSADETIAYQDVGIQPLAKAFGTQQLYQLLRHDEAAKPVAPIDTADTHHVKTDSQILVDSALQQKSSEILDLTSRLRNASSFMQEVICYNQGEYAQYQFLAGELHKVLRTSSGDVTVLCAHCDRLENFLNRNLESVAQRNFAFFTNYFRGRHTIDPRACIKANFRRDGKAYIAEIARSRKVNYSSPHLLDDTSGFEFVKKRGLSFGCNNIPKGIANGSYENDRIDFDLAKTYWEEKKDKESTTSYDKDFQWDEAWIKCWRVPKHEDGSDKEIDNTSCYKSTLIIPMTLWNNELDPAFLEKINIKAREEASRIIFGYLCLDHIEEHYFKNKVDIDVGYMFADILSLYMITRATYTEFSDTFSDARGLGSKE